MYKAIIFDFFDVIHADCFQAWLKKHGYKREGKFEEASRLVDSGKVDSQGFFERLSLASGISATDIESEFEVFEKLDEDIVKLIKALKKHYKLGLISNAGSDHLRFTLKRYGLESLFDEIIISSEVGILKPEQKIFHLMLNNFSIDAAEAIFIDDHKNNIEAANSLSIHGIWYQNFTLLRHELIDLDVIIDSNG